MSSRTVRASQYWDVKMPPPKKHMVGGVLVKNVGGSIGRNFMQKTRRIGIEIHSPRATSPFKNPTNASMMRGLLRGQRSRLSMGIGSNELTDDCVVLIKIFKPSTSNDGEHSGDVEDDASMSTLGLGGADEEPEQAWIEAKCYLLHEVEVVRIGKTSCDAKLGTGSDLQLRQINFASPREVRAFYKDLTKLQDYVKNIGSKSKNPKRRSSFNTSGNSEKEGAVHRSPSYHSLGSQDPEPGSQDAEGGLDADRDVENGVVQGLDHLKDDLKDEKILEVSMSDRSVEPQDGGDLEEFLTPNSGRSIISEPVALTPCSILSDQAEDETMSLLESGAGVPTYGQRGLPATFLIEIVAAINLPVADRKSSDPYVIVSLGSEEIHRTQHIIKTTNPVWTLENGSLFLLETNASNPATELTFLVRDYDRLTANDFLGSMSIPRADLADGNSERLEFSLTKEDGTVLPGNARLVLRYRPASETDIVFVKQFALDSQSNVFGGASNQTFVPPIVHRVARSGDTRKVGDVVQHRVKPGPEVGGESEITWMTVNEMAEEVMKPSKMWVEAGSGDIGKLYFEILSCEALPDMDKRSLRSVDTTDAFACIVFEDCVVNTDVINNSENPQWMPWTQRAFVFNINHPSSQVLLGIIDYDGALGGADDAIGRVSIDFSNFLPKTEYCLFYDLYTSGNVDTREKCGRVQVRLSFEWTGYRRSVLASLKSPPANFTNLVAKKDFQNAYAACVGTEDTNSFSMDILKSYIHELQEIKDIGRLVKEALVTIVLWRGHYSVRLPGCCGQEKSETKIWLPLHSIVAFAGGILLIENFNLLPSMFFFGIAWIFLATMEKRRQHPSPWEQPRSYSDQFLAFLSGMPMADSIAANENQDAISAYQATNNDEAQQRLDAAARQKEADQQLKDELNAMAVDNPNVNVTKKGVTLNPLAPVLLPAQKILGRLCVSKRIVKSIATWDEPNIAFCITTGSILMGLLLFWVPWGFLLRWIVRIAVWTFLGPWMKLVDIFIVRRSAKQNDEVQTKKTQAKRKKLVAASNSSHIRKEETLKMASWKRHLFGKFTIAVPRFKEYRYRDIPLAASSAAPIDSRESSLFISKKRRGQTLSGTMVPMWPGKHEIPVVQLVKAPNLSAANSGNEV